MLLHKSVEFDSRVRREASALAQAGHEVTVLELAELVGAAGSQTREGARTGAGSDPVCAYLDGFARRSVLPPAWLRRHVPFHLYRAAFLWSFVAGIRRVRPEVIHAHDAAMLLPGLVGARLTGARLVYDSHELATSVPYRERAWAAFVAGIERLAVPRCAAVITVSDGIAERLRVRYGLRAKPCVVRNVSALRGDGRGGLRERLGIDAAVPLVLHQGAPAQARGCEVLVEAVAQLPGVALAFLGDPEPSYGARLRELITARGLKERVRLLPSVALEDLLAHTAEADVGVTLLQDTCLNHRLALPNKLFEYIAAGVPVVAAALPETERLVQEYGVGWCARSDDASAVAEALCLALYGSCDPASDDPSDPAPRDSHDRELYPYPDPDLRERLRRAAEELSWEHEQLRLLELYERLSAVGTHEHEAVGAQHWQASERPVATSGAPGERRQQSDGANGYLAAEPVAQLAQADEARVGVGAKDPRLPNDDAAAGGEHAPYLGERLADLVSPAHGG